MSNKIYTCPKCSQIFRSEKVFIRHVEREQKRSEILLDKSLNNETNMEIFHKETNGLISKSNRYSATFISWLINLKEYKEIFKKEPIQELELTSDFKKWRRKKIISLQNKKNEEKRIQKETIKILKEEELLKRKKKPRRKGVNYRKIYQENTNDIIKSNEVIHHIDMNHYNNEISNLIKLGKKEHQNLHGEIISIGHKLFKYCFKEGIITFNSFQNRYYVNWNLIKNERKYF